MKKYLFIIAVMMAVCLPSKAQTMATDFKGNGNNNPISANIFCADPTALVYNGRLYVYGSNDHQQFIKNGKKKSNDYGEIKSIVVFSTDDMVNWTFHGTIDTKKICSQWVPNVWPTFKGYGVSWAPSVTWRTTEDGTDEFFLYFCNNVHGIGVLKANSPIGPWTSPNKELMIHRGTPGATPSSAVFDPGVVIDDNGVGWLAIGGLDPVKDEGGTDFDPKNARIYKLTPDMTAVDGLPVRIPAPYHFEANELNVINGKFVYTYCSNWADRTDAEWNAYKAEKNISVGKPEKCTMCYMVSDNPQDPDSWIYKGVYGPQASAYNNHSHLQKFQGRYYHIYHSFELMNSMKSANAIDGSCDLYRSFCVNEATVNESTQHIDKVTLKVGGVTQIKKVNPYEWQEAETMASCGGVDYEDFTNIKRNTTISALGNDASENMQVKMKASSWINVRGINYGESGATKFTLRAKGTATIELRNGSNRRTKVATIEFSSTEMEEQTFDVPADKLKGVKDDLYIFVTVATDFYVDAWKFSNVQSSGIQVVNDGTPVTDIVRYDLSGRRLSDASHHHGIVIEQYTDNNGVSHTRKTLYK